MDEYCQHVGYNPYDMSGIHVNDQEPCTNPLQYCFRYSWEFLHYQWNKECYAYLNRLKK